jgi:hypothetical protein
VLRWLFGLRQAALAAETSRLVVGSTGSGKSEGELHDLVRLADRGDCAVVLLDGHGPLAFAAAGHLGARGQEARLVYEPLHAVERVLTWEMLPASTAEHPSRRALEDAETRDDVAQAFMAQRNLLTLTDKPWTKEWLDAAIDLGLGQPQSEPLPSLLHAFRIGSPAYERMLSDCRDGDLVAKFRELETLRRKNVVQYEIQTGAARRLLELVCGSEVVRLRSRVGPFQWLSALRDHRLILFDGGGIRSREIKRTVFLLASMQVFHAVRQHFAETGSPLPVVLVLEEAGALGLVTPFVLAALQELRKAGLAIHLITQSSLDFGDRDLFQAVLANVPWLGWYQSLAPADQALGAQALTNATFDPLAIHFTRTRQVRDGVDPVETHSHGETTDPHGLVTRQDARSGTTFLPRYRDAEEAYFKSPQLQEQEYRTALATLRIGERFVRDRSGVRRERLRPLRPPRRWRPFADRTREMIARIRLGPLYLPAVAPAPPDESAALPDAAARLRGDVPRTPGDPATASNQTIC